MDTGDAADLADHEDCQQLETEGGNKMPFRKRLRNTDYRKKLLSTSCIFLAFAAFGWIIGQRGPAYLDIQLITDTDIQKGSTFFTVSSVGYLLATLVGGILLDMYSRRLIMFFSVALMGVMCAIIPWCENFWLMILGQTVIGISFGVVDTGGNAIITRIWSEKVKEYMQAVHFAYALGGVVSPLAVKPYLAKKQENTTLHAVKTTNASLDHNTRSTDTNQTSPFHSTSMIYIPFSITAVLCVLAALPFLVQYCLEKEKVRKNNVKPNLTKGRKRLPDLPISLKLVTLYLLGQLMLLYCSLEDCTISFLVTFVVKQLNWSKQRGADLTSLFWGAFALVRFIGIFVAHFLHASRMILICCICIFISFIGLYFGVVYYTEELVWFFTAMVGASMSFVFASIFTWTEEDIIAVSAKIASFFLVMASLGTSLSPLLFGYLMEEFSPMSYLYILMAFSVLCIATFITLWLIVNYKIKQIWVNTERYPPLELT